MGLKITTELYSDAGSSTETYINIKSINLLKNSGLSIGLNNYLDKATKELNENDTIVCRKLYSSIFIGIEKDSPDFISLTTDSIYSFAYSKLKEKLISDGLLVEDDI